MNANAIILEQMHGCPSHQCYGEDLDPVLLRYVKCFTLLAGMYCITKNEIKKEILTFVLYV